MAKYQILMWLLNATWVLFVFAHGACMGSLVNVLVYRMPRGLNTIWPPSRCPSCDTRLSWRDNIPVLGWLALRGKCRYCRKAISPEYPIVEAFVGLLFVLFFVVWYLLPRATTLGGFDLSAMTPRWTALNTPYNTWPEFLVLLTLLTCLVAMTLIDAKTFTIPLKLTWAPAIAAVIVHPLHAAWFGQPGIIPPRAQIGWTWAIPTPSDMRWDVIGLSIGGVAGLGIGLLLLYFKLISRSFEDFPAWEEKAIAAQEAAAKAAQTPVPVQEGLTPVPEGLMPVSAGVSEVPAAPPVEPGSAPSSPELASCDPELWRTYPHARREMVKELAFLAPCILLMLLGWYAGRHFGGMSFNPLTGFSAKFSAPLWLTVLSGVLLGYLVGAGVVWFVRIAGSFGFGKEAMGMGDVHLMGGIGACLGWIDATLGFFGAAFVGLAWAVLGRIVGGKFLKTLPYGPFLAVSTVLVLLCKPLLEKLLTHLTGQPIHLPP
jgi:leader peptidase (prepilin peptidase) / N-methyltransferase